MLKFIICWIIALFPYLLAAQFSISLEPFTIDGLNGLHSFAFAQHEGKWLILAGRKDGLHGKYSGFGKGEANTTLYVVDPINRQTWTASNENLPQKLREQVQSANMEFLQDDSQLLFIGGYGESELADDYITYPALVVIDVPGLMNAIIDGNPVDSTYFQRIEDDYFAITGGQLQKLEEEYYLVGGHRFDGFYVTGWGGNVVQKYSNAIRKFKLANTEEGIIVTDRSEEIDEINLHRRDYNLAPQIMEDGSIGLTVFSGVFQPEAVLPFLNLCNISKRGHQSVNNFNQYLANYTCAKVPLYDSDNQEMHTLFFGGMSRYYYQDGELIDDKRIPFVKTISCVTRKGDGTYEEYALHEEMPVFVGTNAEFIPNPEIAHIDKEIIDLNKITGDSVLIGYIFGGIVSPDSLKNPYVENKVNQTYSGNSIFKVFLHQTLSTSIGELVEAGKKNLNFTLSPNPVIDEISLQTNLPESGNLHLWLQDISGKLLKTIDLDHQIKGEHNFQVNLSAYPSGTYLLTANLSGRYLTTKKIVIE